MKNAIVVLMLLTLLQLSLSAQTAKRPIYFSFDDNNFSATGRWVPADKAEKSAFPSETEIDCFRGGMGCVESTAEYSYGHPHVSVSYLEVIKWDSNGIIATSSDGICMTNTVLISFVEKRISVTDSMKKLSEKSKGACNFFGAKETTTSFFILKGSERWNAEGGS